MPDSPSVIVLMLFKVIIRFSFESSDLTMSVKMLHLCGRSQRVTMFEYPGGPNVCPYFIILPRCSFGQTRRLLIQDTLI